MGRKTKQNKIITDELVAQINPQNSRLLDDYVTYMRSVKRSEETISGYINDLRIFFCWLVKNAGNKYFVDITKRDIVGFQGFMVNTLENSPARIRRMKSSLSALSNYVVNLLDDEYPNFRNIVNKVENPLNEPVREKTVLSDEQICKLMEKLLSDGECQKACVLALAAYSGARKAELVRFRDDFFIPENVVLGSLYKTPKIKTKGRSGGKYVPKYVFKNKFDPYLECWRKQRAELGVDSEWLFVSKTSDGSWKQLDASTLSSWAETFSRILGVDFYFHAARHLWTSDLIRHNVPTNVIKELQSWQSTAMCDLYSDLGKEELFAKYFDEDGVKDSKPASLDTL